MVEGRREGLYLFLIGAVCLVAFAALLVGRPPGPLEDFRVIYNPTRCLINGGDPYNPKAVLLASRGTEDRSRARETAQVERIETQAIYPPTTFAVVLPLAMLPWAWAGTIWLLFTGASLLVAAFLIWKMSASYAPLGAGALIALLLAGGPMILVLGNPAGIAIALCVVAVWCFVESRFGAVGVACMAIALALKPHDVALIWFLFLIAGGKYRLRAVQSALVWACVSLPLISWVWSVSPKWYQELGANISALSAPGGPADLSPARIGSRGGGVYTNLQAAAALLSNNPQVYNGIAFAACSILLVLWGAAVWRGRHRETNVWLALASAAPLSMLPLYHHLLDAKLLLLSIPACAILIAKGHPARWRAIGVTATAILVTADVPWGVFLALTQHLRVTPGSAGERILLAAEILPAPLALLAVSAFFLWLQGRDYPLLVDQARGREGHKVLNRKENTLKSGSTG